MANMGYVRFENTRDDLLDCYEHMDEDLSERETRERKWLIELCVQIAEEYGDELED